MKQIVNGTSPSAISDNILSLVSTFLPFIVVKELPSIWTVRQTRTILLIVVEALAVYQLGKSKHISTVPNYSTCQKVIFLANIITVQSSHSELCCLLTSVELHKRGNQWEFSWTDGWLERKKKLL